MRSDEKLMQAVAGGDIDAFGELVRRHQERAWRIAYHYTGNRADAEELAQEAFLRILDAAENYRPSANFTAYLYQVVANLCLDFIRKKRPHLIEALPPHEEQGLPPDEALAAKERNDAIRAALNGLPGRQRMAVILFYFEDLSHSEIASVVRTSVKAVERLLARARNSLAETLGEFLEK